MKPKHGNARQRTSKKVSLILKYNSVAALIEISEKLKNYFDEHIMYNMYQYNILYKYLNNCN